MKSKLFLLPFFILIATGINAQLNQSRENLERKDTPMKAKRTIPPRMSTASRNRITTPEKGQTIYNINKKTYETFNGTNWYQVKHFLGEEFGGGIVYYLHPNGLSGYIVSKADLSCAVQWYNGIDKLIGTGEEGYETGAKKTELIVAKQIGDNANGIFAARLCADYSVKQNGIIYDDWHLPSYNEFYYLHLGIQYIDGVNDNYWTSDETWPKVINSAYTYSFITYDGGYPVTATRGELRPVRAIRKF